MPAYSIPDPESLHREIQASHERCRQLGVNPNDTRNILQNRLTPEELAFRFEQNREFLEIAIAQIEELYQFVSGAGFAVNIADNEITATRIAVIVLHDFAHEDLPMHASVTWYQYVTSRDTQSALSKRLKTGKYDEWQAVIR